MIRLLRWLFSWAPWNPDTDETVLLLRAHREAAEIETARLRRWDPTGHFWADKLRNTEGDEVRLP